MEQEIWKDIKDYDGLYQVSNLGRIKSVERYSKGRWETKNHKKERILKHFETKKGYLNVALSKNNKLKTFQIHRLVAQTFIPNSLNKSQVNHIDGNKLNNCVSNLEWATNKENMKHAYKNGLITKENIKKCVFCSMRKIKRPVVQIKDNEIIREFDSVISVSRYFGNKQTSGINKALKNHSIYKGYYWEYKEKGN